MIDKCNLTGIGTVAIRILAGGALTGSCERHPISAQEVAPISTGKSMKDDVSQSLNYSFLVDEGYVEVDKTGIKATEPGLQRLDGVLAMLLDKPALPLDL